MAGAGAQLLTEGIAKRPQDIDMAASSAGPDALIMGVTYEPVPRIDVIRRAS